MSSHSHTNFQPVPPIRTNTVDSQKSQSSGQMSPPASPASPASPTTREFFGAITQRIRGRSRSRSRDASQRSKSPMVMPPAQVQQTSSTRPSAVPLQSARPSVQDTGRRSTSSTSGSDPWRGRHSNDWLFNGYSVTATAKDIFQRRKS